MLIENTGARAIYCGGRLLFPGMNEISDEEKASLERSGYWAGLMELKEYGDIRLVEGEKPTTALVAKTFDIKLLESWLDDAPAPLRRAIEKQIKSLKEVPEGSTTITVS